MGRLELVRAGMYLNIRRRFSVFRKNMMWLLRRSIRNVRDEAKCYGRSCEFIKIYCRDANRNLLLTSNTRLLEGLRRTFVGVSRFAKRRGFQTLSPTTKGGLTLLYQATSYALTLFE